MCPIVSALRMISSVGYSHPMLSVIITMTGSSPWLRFCICYGRTWKSIPWARGRSGISIRIIMIKIRRNLQLCTLVIPPRLRSGWKLLSSLWCMVTASTSRFGISPMTRSTPSWTIASTMTTMWSWALLDLLVCKNGYGLRVVRLGKRRSTLYLAWLSARTALTVLCHGVLLSYWWLAIVIGNDDIGWHRCRGGFANPMPLVSRHWLSIVLYIF